MFGDGGLAKRGSVRWPQLSTSGVNKTDPIHLPQLPVPPFLDFYDGYGPPDNGWAGHKDNERFNLNSLESYLFLIIFHDCSSALRDALKSQTTASSSETDRLPQTLPSANAWTLKRSVLAAGLPSP